MTQLRLPGMQHCKLFPREYEIINLIIAGDSNKIIAYKLNLKYSTIKMYLFRIYKKAQVSNRTELAVWAIRNGSNLDRSAA